MNDDRLYCLQYVRRNPENNGDYQSFCMSSTVDMCATLTLKPPPVILDDVSLCPSKNSIYLYNQTLSRRRSSSVNHMFHFTDEEISNGIYVYNCELDHWFPVPLMPAQVKDASLVLLDCMLYLIGGFPPSNYVFDQRVGKWQVFSEFPIAADCYHVRADCATLNGKIYVCGGVGTEIAEQYDPKIGEWETIAPMMKPMQDHRIMPFSDKIWVMETFFEDICSHNFSDIVHVYDPSLNEWKNSSILSKAVEEAFGTTEGTILDCVVF